jgi:hypothetical protein
VSEHQRGHWPVGRMQVRPRESLGGVDF